MARDHTKTVQIRKVDKVAPDTRGRSVWLGKIEPVELELVSTTALAEKTGAIYLELLARRRTRR